MNSSRVLSSETSPNTHSRTRSTSTTSRASSSHSSSSQESNNPLHKSGRSNNPQSTTKPTHKKSNSLGKIFGAKEPSLDSFKQLVELQQKELAQKGQKLPFGVPQAKLPSSVKDDYKKSKQRAKERAKLHEAVKEKLKLHDQEEQQRHSRKFSIDSIMTDGRRSFSATSTVKPPKSPKSSHTKFAALDTLPELPTMDAVAESPRPRPPPPSPHAGYEYKRPLVQVAGVLKGDARKEALPWE